MKNGFIKNTTDKLLPLNSSKNIEHKGLKLYDYLNNLKKNIVNMLNINSVTTVGIAFNTYTIQNDSTYENINYTDLKYNRSSCSDDYEVTSDGIVIKNKNRCCFSISAEVRNRSNDSGQRYMKIEIYHDGTLTSEETISVSSSYEFECLNLTNQFYCYPSSGDTIKIKFYGFAGDVVNSVKVNMVLNRENINYYDF